MTLVELMVVVVIGVIALMALSIPFAAERTFWNTGWRKTEAQRDAQMVFRAISKMARQSQSYTVTNVAAGNIRIDFVRPTCGTVYFQGGVNYPGTGQGQFLWQDGCAVPANAKTLIDGVRSRVTNFSVTSISGRILKINLTIIHKNQETEQLEKQVFLRNAP